MEDFQINQGVQMYTPDGYTKGHKKWYASLAGVVILLLMILAYYLITSRDIKIEEPSINTIQTQTVAPAPDPRVAKEETLEAALVEISEDATFIRTSVTGKGLVSVGIDASTTITLNGEPAPITAFDPLAKVTLVAVELPDTEMYDYRAESISLTSAPESELEIKTRKMIDLGLTQEI